MQAHHNEALRKRMVERNRQATDTLAKVLSGEGEPVDKHRNFVNLIGALSSGLSIRYALDPDPKLMELWAKVATKLFRDMQAE